MDFYKHPRLREGTRHISFLFVYFLAIVFSYHTLLVAYSTSSFIGHYLSPTAVGALHGLAAMGAVGCFLYFPRLLARFGNVLVAMGMMALSCILLLVLAFSATESTLIIALLLFLAINPLGYLIIDVFSENLIGDHEDDTGAKRGLTLALMSAAAVFAPLSMGYLMGEGEDYTRLFIASAGIGMLFIAVIVGSFRHFYDPPYHSIAPSTMLRSVLASQNITTVMACHFLLQLFFAWVIVYVPLYFITVVGFSWQEIGLIIAAGLMAYVIFEYPIGIIADRYLGEQEMMSLGFVILSVTTACLGLLAGAGVIAFMILMFINRLGASLVEVTTESYFFKHVSGEDAALMAMFRLLRPIATVTGALIGSVMLLLVSFPVFFLIGGLMLVSGVFIPRYLEDTK